MKKRNQVVIGLIAAIIMLACACPVSGLPFGSEEQPTPGLPILPVATIVDAPATEAPVQPAANVLLSDDFSSPSAEMETYSGDGGSAGTENGVYIVRSTLTCGNGVSPIRSLIMQSLKQI